MQCLYVLFDAGCDLCSRLARWSRLQPAYLDLVFLPAGSPEALARFPGLSKPGRPAELIVVSDEGGVYRDDHAWIMCLYALVEYREWSLRLASPTLLPLARAAFSLVSRNRDRLSRLLNHAEDATVADVLRREPPSSCDVVPPNAHGALVHRVRAD